MTLEWSSSYGPVDEDFADVSLLLKGEGTNGSTTILDSSSNNLSVSVVNDAKISTTVATPFSPTVPSDGVLAFDGTGDYIQTANSNDFKFGSGDFTIEYWFYGTDLSGSRQHINTDNSNTGPTANASYAILTTPSGSNADVLYYLSSVGNSWDIASSISIGIISPNTWNHIALVRSGNTFTGYLNGIAGGTATSSASLYNFTSPFVLGASSDFRFYTAGYFSNFRITKGVARYTSNFTPPTAPFPILSPSTRIEVGDGFDVEAANYILAVEAADAAAGQSGGLEPGVRTAINDFVVGCKSDGIWNAIKASCLLSGARTLEGALVPLKGGPPTNFNFTSSDYDRKTGLVGDASTKYIDTTATQQSQQLNNNHLSVYISSAHTSATQAMYIGGNGHDIYRDVANLQIRNLTPAGSGAIYSGLGGNSGFAGSSRNLATSFLARFNSTDTTVSSNSVSASSSITLFKRGSSSPLFTNARLAFYSIGEALPDLSPTQTGLELLDTRISDFITAIGVAI